MINPSQPKDQKIHLKTVVPGPKSRALRKDEDTTVAPGLQGYALMAGIAIDHAEGSAITDVDGNQFLDVIGGINVNALGHSHPIWVKAVQEQAARAAVGSLTSAPRVELLARLRAKPPAPDVTRAQLYSSGAEAVESALRLAKSHTRKYEFVSCSGGFHGKTLGAMSLMGSPSKRLLGPFAAGSHQIPYADCYRCPLKLRYPTCGVACAEVGRDLLKKNSAGAMAALIVEPIQGTAGNIVPPKEFLPALKSIAEEFDALFIADEMITGFGRTGRYWGVEHSSVKPDIVTLGKAFGGGFPLSAVMTTEEIGKAKPWADRSGSSSSYGGNPLGAAAGAASLRIIEEENLVENSKQVGAFLLKELEVFVERYPFVGYVSGEGMLLRMELVSDKATRTPLSTPVTERIFDECVKRGLLTMAYSASFRIQPALTLDEATARNALEVLREVFDLIEREDAWG